MLTLHDVLRYVHGSLTVDGVFIETEEAGTGIPMHDLGEDFSLSVRSTRFYYVSCGRHTRTFIIKGREGDDPLSPTNLVMCNPVESCDMTGFPVNQVWLPLGTKCSIRRETRQGPVSYSEAGRVKL